MPDRAIRSGSAVNNNGVLTLIYTGHVDGKTPEEVQCLAASTDGVTFHKHTANPVIGDSPDAERLDSATRRYGSTGISGTW